MPTTRERYDALISTMIATDLRERGFRKRRNSFSRQANSGWTLIDFQASQFGTRDDVSFTINLGVSFLELQKRDEGSPSLGRAHIRERIAAVLDRRQDVWWNLHPTSDHAALAAEVNEVIGRVAIPWLEKRALLDDVLAAARSDPNFIEGWHLSRLSVLAERIGKPNLADELRDLAQREAT